MKQSLWILNSSLLTIFFLILFLNNVLKQDVPIIRIKTTAGEFEKKKSPIIVNIDKIFTQDLFDTFKALERQITKKILITPIPELKFPNIQPPEQPKSPELIPNLNIVIKGLILSSDESKSVAMISDEANKERIYHIGDMIKDGQILKISKNKTIILRANGQQEIYLLRKTDIPKEKLEKKWLYTIKKIDDTIYHIDPTEFIKDIQTLGQFLEDFSISTAYKNGETVGIKIGQLDKNSIAQHLGLNQNDILDSINGVNLYSVKNRIKIYDKITQMELGDDIKIALNRQNKNINITYKIKKIDKPKKDYFIQSSTEETSTDTKAKPTEFKLGPQQKREASLKQFKNVHYTPQQQNTIHDIRQRLRDNMMKRRMNRRVR